MMKKMLMRRTEAMEMLGVTDYGFRQLLQGGRLKPFRLATLRRNKNARVYFKTAEVERLVC